MSKGWNTGDIPDQSGRVAVVTGANSGLGLHAASALAERGARVVLAVRNVGKGEEAAQQISAGPDQVEVRELDLSSLDSVRSFVAGLGHQRVDLLVNNAGIMMTPPQKTADGFELQLGTNHLGHFALTGLLLDRLQGSRRGAHRDREQHRAQAGPHPLRRPAARAAATRRARPTSSRSWPTPSSASSSTGACARPRTA